MTISAIIPAAGVGSRFAQSQKKQFYGLGTKPVIYYTIKALIKSYDFDELIIGASEEDFKIIEKYAKEAGAKAPVIVLGGEERADTVYNCVKAAKSEYVLVHDAVRPFITTALTADVIKSAVSTGGAICGLYSRDTVKLVSGNKIEKTLDRNHIFLAHTPQVFKRVLLEEAMGKALEAGVTLTDESSAFEFAGFPVSVVESSPDNIKITLIQDLEMVNSLMGKYF